MKDRDIAIGYQNIKDGSAFEVYDKAYSELEKQDFGKVLCVNDNFGLNSLVKKYHDCECYDMVVLNGTHQRYCFNVFPELLVDNFFTDMPDLDKYDTVVVDYANIDKDFADRVVKQWHGTVIKFTDCVEVVEKEYVELDLSDGLEDAKNGNFVEGPDVDGDLDDFASEEEAQEMREKLVESDGEEDAN